MDKKEIKTIHYSNSNITQIFLADMYQTASVNGIDLSFTDPFSLSFSFQLSLCFQPQNIWYSHLPSPDSWALHLLDWWFGGRGFLFLMIRWEDILFWFLESYQFNKHAIQVEYVNLCWPVVVKGLRHAAVSSVQAALWKIEASWTVLTFLDDWFPS